MFSIFKRKKEPKPLKWEDITLGQFERMQRLDSRDENYLFNFAAIVFGFGIDDFSNLPLSEVNEYMARVQPLLNEAPQGDLSSITSNHYKMNGADYRLLGYGNEMTLAQYIDFQASYKTCGENMAEFLSIILVPMDKTYNEGYTRDDVAEDIRRYMPITDAIGLSRFFFRKWRKSVESSLTFSERVLMARLFKERKTLTEEERMDIDKALTGLRLQRKVMREQERELGFR